VVGGCWCSGRGKVELNAKLVPINVDFDWSVRPTSVPVQYSR